MRKIMYFLLGVVFITFPIISYSASCDKTSIDACVFFYKKCVQLRNYGDEQTAVNLMKITCELQLKQHLDVDSVTKEILFDISERCCRAAYRPGTLKTAIKDSIVECYEKTYEKVLDDYFRRNGLDGY